METNLNLFYNEEANVTIRTQQVNEEPWFVAKDVVAALGIGWNGTTLASIPDEWKGMRTFRTPSSGTRGGGEQMLTVIDEAALYKLAFRSNKPQADTFVNWVAGVVLPKSAKPASTGSRARRSACGSSNNANACPCRSTARSSRNGNSG